jgi:hypothetical protein
LSSPENALRIMAKPGRTLSGSPLTGFWINKIPLILMCGNE